MEISTSVTISVCHARYFCISRIHWRHGKSTSEKGSTAVGRPSHTTLRNVLRRSVSLLLDKRRIRSTNTCTTGRLCLLKFCKGVRAAFTDEFLKKPTTTNCQFLLQLHEQAHGEVLNGKAPVINFIANNRQYKMGYYLADDIYLWPTFVKTFNRPANEKQALFAQKQEAARKDVE
ncbi:uncharacterized protein LOC125194675 [Salvia hispanica]|uniref:uncharacterized protein LOC125194675 n=1 Tax=Salvia hispanica TaxID=49212 RepID=UPI002009628F|nr:uncharacterized protein LOC125194675 [Salvia hispanica]